MVIYLNDIYRMMMTIMMMMMTMMMMIMMMSIQNGHNSANFEVIISIFCMVIDLN